MNIDRTCAAGLLLLLMPGISGAILADDCKPFADQIKKIEQSYNQGQLEKAERLALTELDCGELLVEQQVQLHLKLSAIYDRVGLHQNTRPVAKSSEHIEIADRLSSGLDPITRARVSLARAKYYYRAEMAERKFVEAEKHGQAALAAFTATRDIFGQADAVHALGLIYFQRRQMAEAQAFFDRSLVLERGSGAPRAVMLADYGRHVGYIHYVSGDTAAAIPHFEQSFADRVQGGLKDPAMFAAVTLASALTDEGRLGGVAAPLEYALNVADELGSPNGKVRALLVAGKYSVAQNNIDQAKAAYTEARDIAAEIGLSSSAARAQENLDQLMAGNDENQ